VKDSDQLLDVRDLRKSFAATTSALERTGNGSFRRAIAVDGVTFSVRRGETLGIVGESGCGKTTLARMIVRLIEPDSGEMHFRGHNWLAAKGEELRALRSRVQMVFQDPIASLNARMRVGAIVSEPLAIHEPRLARREREARAQQILDAVGLGGDSLARYPHEFSGGQRQRIGIARALVLRPDLVVADEPVSALDVSVGAQIVNLLQRLQREFGLTYLFISHSMPVVRYLSTRIAVMYQGKIVEVGTTAEITEHPRGAYTKNLLAATPEIAAS
jgi:ABC-type glutathione transport system ATPase component